MILQTYVEGVLSPEQLENLRHLEQVAPNWFWWDKGRKDPRSPHGGPGKVDDPSTAGTLDQALQAMGRRGGGGVGVLVSAGVPGLVGIDVDNVIHNGDVHSLGLEVIERFPDAYIEVSPSGTGLRGFCLGTIPAGTPAGSTAIGQDHHGKQIKFEIYASGGGGRYLRVTGLPVDSTRAGVGSCQAGADWFSGAMMAAKADKAPSASNPDKAKDIDDVFAELAELRPALEIEALIVALDTAAARQPRGAWAELRRGCLTRWKNDHSPAAEFFCCEVIRRGAGHSDDVVSIWEVADGLRKHDSQKKFSKRAKWVLDTIEKAARNVLVELQDKAAKRASPAPAIELPAAVVESLAQTGDKVTRTKSGRLEPTESNVVMVFRNDPRVKGVLGFNELEQRAHRRASWRVFDRGGNDQPGPVSDDDVTRVSMWLAVEYGMRMDYRCLMRAVEAAAIDAKFDPLKDRLLALGKSWDGVPRVDSWLVQHALVDATNCAEYVSLAGRCFLVGAVARALNPGCQLDTVLSVEGAGGGGKSSMFKVLADAVAGGLFADGVHDVSDQVALIEGTAGRWIVELAELAGIRRASDVEALKASITRTEDTHRRPYDVMSRTIARRFIFVATTNRVEGYLADTSGALARRFHPVRTLSTESRPIDRAALAAVAEQLWAEAVVMFQAGKKWHIGEADGVAFTQWVSGRELRREDGAFQNELVDYLQKWAGEDPAGGRSLTEIAVGVGDKKTAESGGVGAAAMQLAGTLTMLGMEKRKSGVSRWYFTPAAATRFAMLREKALREQPGTAGKAGLRAV